jgi:hypothetical protein
MDRAIQACEEAGLRYSPGKKHARVVDDRTGKFVSFSRTPSCPYAYKNMLRDVKRYLGIEIRLK